MTVWLAALLRSEPYLNLQHCKLVFEGFNMRKNIALPLSFSSNFIQAPQVVSDTSEANPQKTCFPLGGHGAAFQPGLISQ